MEIEYIEGDIERAILNLKKAMNKKYIIYSDYVIYPMYNKHHLNELL